MRDFVEGWADGRLGERARSRWSTTATNSPLIEVSATPCLPDLGPTASGSPGHRPLQKVSTHRGRQPGARAERCSYALSRGLSGIFWPHFGVRENASDRLLECGQDREGPLGCSRASSY